MKLALGLLSLFVMFGASAEYYEQDALNIYRVRPLSSAMSSEEMIKYTSDIAKTSVESTLKSMVEKDLFPKFILEYEDVEKLRASNKKVEGLIEYTNQLIEDLRGMKGSSRFSLADLIPDAYLVFIGKKVSIALGPGLGGSVSFGLVLMPMKVDTYKKSDGNLVSQDIEMRVSMVVWPNGDLKMGSLGGGVGLRMGIGAIWDLHDNFIRPDQFQGAGIGMGWSPFTAGFGTNFKGGLLANFDLPGWADFVYATAGVEFGAIAQAGLPHVNGTWILSGEKVLNMFETAQQKAIKGAEKDIQKAINEAFKGALEGVEGPRKNTPPGLSDEMRGIIMEELETLRR